MTPELERALNAVCSMKFPTVANLLRRKGYEYEAQQVEALVTAWEAAQQGRAVNV